MLLISKSQTKRRSARQPDSMFTAHATPLAAMGVARETTARLWRGVHDLGGVRHAARGASVAVILGGSGGAWLMQGRVGNPVGRVSTLSLDKAW